MATKDELDAINSRILELQQKRDEINKDEIQKEKEFIASLSWTKDYEAELECEDNRGAGTAKYKIRLYGPEFKLSYNNHNVVIFGTYDMFHEDCLVFSSYGSVVDSYPYLRTSNNSMLIKLINNHQFKNFRADWDLLNIMKLIEEKYGN